MTILTSNVCSSFLKTAIGSRVVDADAFLSALTKAIEAHDASKDRVTGQHSIAMPTEAHATVSAGVGKRSTNVDDYIVRIHRGTATMFLRRKHAVAVEGLTAIVYTRAAYLADPDTQKDSLEMERVGNSDATHVLVAVLASAGPRSPLTPDRFVKNLAGDNREALAWNADDIRAKAAEIASYYGEWCVVAD